jgi:hypothetical protein
MDRVLVLRTPLRPKLDAACSLLEHDGIPYEVRETRELFGYLPQEDLQLRVPHEHALAACALMNLLDQPSHPAHTPYRSQHATFEEEAEASDDMADMFVPRALLRRRRALLLVAACTLTTIVVIIGTGFAYHEFFAQATPRITTPSTKFGVFRGP